MDAMNNPSPKYGGRGFEKGGGADSGKTGAKSHSLMIDGATQAASMDVNGGETSPVKAQDVRQKTQVDYLPAKANVVEVRPRVASKSVVPVETEVACYSPEPSFLKQAVAEVVSVEGIKALAAEGGIGHFTSHCLDILVGQASGPISPSPIIAGETLGLTVADGRVECSPMEGISVSSNPNPSSVRKWKKMARISKKQILGPSSPIQKIIAARRRGRSGSCSPGRKSPFLKLSLSDSPEAGSKRKGSSPLAGLQSGSVFDFLCGLSSSLIRREFELLCVTLWVLWFDRNSFVHNGALKEVQDFLPFSVSLLEEFQNTAGACSVLKEVPSLQPRSAEILSWVPPPSGSLKLNSDASFLKDSACSFVGLGAAIRDSTGRVVAAVSKCFAGSKNLGCAVCWVESDASNVIKAVVVSDLNLGFKCYNVSNVAEAEARAILMGIQLAGNRGLSHLYVESNSLNVVNLCCGDTTRPTSASFEVRWLEVSEIHDWCEGSEEVHVLLDRIQSDKVLDRTALLVDSDSGKEFEWVVGDDVVVAAVKVIDHMNT
ncbi:hypothetical protein ACOSQ3_002371 [Xanthoceras sorbifolium]